MTSQGRITASTEKGPLMDEIPASPAADSACPPALAPTAADPGAGALVADGSPAPEPSIAESRAPESGVTKRRTFEGALGLEDFLRELL